MTIRRFIARRLNVLLVSAPLALWVTGSIAYNAKTPLPSCPFKALTGLDCPGCGTTRAGASLLRGDVLGALDHHALVIAAPAVIALLWLLKTVAPSVRPVWNWLAVRPAFTALVVIGSFWALRLLPLTPFDVLASGRL